MYLKNTSVTLCVGGGPAVSMLIVFCKVGHGCSRALVAPNTALVSASSAGKHTCRAHPNRLFPFLFLHEPVRVEETVWGGTLTQRLEEKIVCAMCESI